MKNKCGSRIPRSGFALCHSVDSCGVDGNDVGEARVREFHSPRLLVEVARYAEDLDLKQQPFCSPI